MLPVPFPFIAMKSFEKQLFLLFGPISVFSQMVIANKSVFLLLCDCPLQRQKSDSVVVSDVYEWVRMWNVSVCVCVSVFVFVCVCVYVCLFVYVCVSVCVCLCVAIHFCGDLVHWRSRIVNVLVFLSCQSVLTNGVCIHMAATSLTMLCLAWDLDTNLLISRCSFIFALLI